MNNSIRFGLLLFFALISCNLGINAQNILAFPGAEGFGRYATGGRGGSIYRVTNLNDAGEGSLRDAVSQQNRIVVFDVSGIIRLKSTLVFSKNLSILGQTAPGEGIQVYGDRVSFSGADNIIVRYLRIRMGIDGTSGKDAAGVANGKNMIFDHLSVLWGRDENFSISWDNKGTEPTNITIQNSIIGQGLQSHSCGGLVQTGGGVSLFRNLYIENKTRNPKVKGLNQFVNNVVYNWGNGGCYIMGDSEGPSWAHIENNYFINGPWEGATAVFTRANENFTYYGAGNYHDANKNGQLDGILMPANQYSTAVPVSDWASWDNSTARPQPHPVISGMMTAGDALAWIIDSVGPCLPVRDEVDQYLIDELISYGTKGTTNGISTEKTLPHKGTGTLYGGYKPLDTDNDGIPDEWETANGLNPNDASDAAAIAPNGYSNIENYSFSISSAYPYIKSPSALNKKKVDKTSVELVWKDNSGDETAFQLEIASSGGVYDLLATLPADSTEYTVNDLLPETSYSFRVRAVNQALQSPYSNVLSVTTLGDPEIPHPCSDPNPEDEGVFGVASTLRLSWSNTTNSYGGTLYYKLYFGSHTDSLNLLADGLTTTSFALLSKLSPNTDYYWRVDTRNEMGETPGTLWSFRAMEGGTLFYTDFYTTPTQYYDIYGNISGNTNIINAANTTKTVGGMVFGSGSKHIRIVAMNGANNSADPNADYGPYTSEDEGASNRCMQFYTKDSLGGYLRLPEVQGPCVITIWAGNPDNASKTFHLNTIINGSESRAATFSMANKKRIFKFSYVYEGREKVQFKIDANGKKLNINDIHIEQFVPVISEEDITFASQPDTADVSYADGTSLKFVFNQSIRYHGGIELNGEQFEQMEASASGRELSLTFTALDANTAYVLNFPEGSISDYYETKGFEGDFSFSTCDLPPVKQSGETHFGKAAINLPLNFKPFNAVAPFATLGSLIQTKQNDYPHWVQASGGISSAQAVMSSTSDKLMAYVNQRAQILYLKADYIGSGSVVFKVQETRNADAAPYWRTIRQFSAVDFPIEEVFYLNSESRFIKISPAVLSSGTIAISELQLSDEYGNYPSGLLDADVAKTLVYGSKAYLHLRNLPLQSHLNIYALNGLCVKQFQVDNSNMDLSLPAGIYLLRLETPNGPQNIKTAVF